MPLPRDLSPRPNLDMDVLRTFVTGFELGSFAHAAHRLGRSQSTISAQLRKLKDQIGQALVKKSGRGLALTPAGKSRLSYAEKDCPESVSRLGEILSDTIAERIDVPDSRRCQSL